MIRDINNYVENRNRGYVTDDECDLNSWVGLSNWLFKSARERKYNTIGLRR